MTTREVEIEDSEWKKMCNMYRNMFPLATDSSEDQWIYNEDLQYDLGPSEYEKDLNELIFNDVKAKVYQNESYEYDSDFNRSPNQSKVNEEFELGNNYPHESLNQDRDSNYDRNQYEDSKFLPFLGDEDGLGIIYFIMYLDEPPHTLSSANPNFESLK